jgi:hypothetical protein
MGLNVHGYGIHGTNVPSSIGKASSHGCIRMAKADLEELYAQVEVGDTVELVGQRNEETARLFDAPKPMAPPAAQPLLTAQASPASAPVLAAPVLTAGSDLATVAMVLAMGTL